MSGASDPMTHNLMAVEATLKKHILASLTAHFQLPHSVLLEPFFDTVGDHDDSCTLLYVLRLHGIRHYRKHI
jgi:hypothetical protein